MQKAGPIDQISAVLFAFLLISIPSAACAQNVPGAQKVGQTAKQPNPASGAPSAASAPAATMRQYSAGTQPSRVSAEQLPPWLAMTKTVVEVLAYILAFLFFLYKTYVGYLTSNLSLRLVCCRQAATGDGQAGKDHLSVVVMIKKGENGLAKLLLAEARVIELTSGLEQKKAFDIKRVGYERSDVLARKPDAIKWGEERKGWPYLQFPPGDESQFGCLFEVSQGEPCKVDIVVMGRARWPKQKTSQWRASDISLPARRSAIES